MTLVFKILATEEWRAAEAAGTFAGAAVDRADGFIHFSTAEQAPETAAKWFAGRDDLTLVAVDATGGWPNSPNLSSSFSRRKLRTASPSTA